MRDGRLNIQKVIHEISSVCVWQMERQRERFLITLLHDTNTSQTHTCPPISAMLPEARSTAWTSREFLDAAILPDCTGFPLGLGRLYRAYFKLEDPAFITSAHTSGVFPPPVIHRHCPNSALPHGLGLPVMIGIPRARLRQIIILFVL